MNKREREKREEAREAAIRSSPSRQRCDTLLRNVNEMCFQLKYAVIKSVLSDHQKWLPYIFTARDGSNTRTHERVRSLFLLVPPPSISLPSHFRGVGSGVLRPSFIPLGIELRQRTQVKEHLKYTLKSH